MRPFHGNILPQIKHQLSRRVQSICAGLRGRRESVRKYRKDFSGNLQYPTSPKKNIDITKQRQGSNRKFTTDRNILKYVHPSKLGQPKN